MKKVLCCLKGEGSGQRSPERDNVENPVGNNELLNYANRHDLENPGEGSRQRREEPDNVENPFGNNEFLNYAHRNRIELIDDRVPPGAHPLGPQPLELCGVTFQWPEILQGTENLRPEYFLGSGSYGDVYRCDLPNDNVGAAAKIEKEDNPRAHAEFMAEVTTLNRARHPNVIKLLGKCFGRPKPAIIYELMPKRSLDKHLFEKEMRGAQGDRGLDWDRRMVIAVGVAQALVYLHEGLKVIHRDVKSSNVLLDENFMPKLSDFGLACDIVEDEDGEEIDSVLSPDRGTRGYMSPETEHLGVASTKSDVYCYGILLLELFTGRKAYDIERPIGRREIDNWLLPVWSRYDYMPLVIDPALGLRYHVVGLVGVFEAARMCTGLPPHERPDMNEVEQMVRQAAGYPAAECPSFTRRLSV